MNGGRTKRLFSRRLTRTSTQKRLPVPTNCLGDFPDFQGHHGVELQVLFEDELYSMTCTTRTRGRYKKPVLSKGWIEFVQKTELKVGDKVTFSKLELQDGAVTVYVIEVERAVLIEQKREINPAKEVKDTKPFGLSWSWQRTCGPYINQGWLSYEDQATGRSPEYYTQGREQINQLGVGSPSKSLPVQQCGVLIDSATAGRKLEFTSSTMKKIDQSIGELAFDQNSVTSAVFGGSQVLDLTLKLGT